MLCLMGFWLYIPRVLDRDRSGDFPMTHALETTRCRFLSWTPAPRFSDSPQEGVPRQQGGVPVCCNPSGQLQGVL